MIKIAICDDEIEVLTRISKLVNKYQEEKKTMLKYDSFLSATELLEAMKHSVYDVLILDVLMPGLNGIETAHEIREFNSEVNIIFLTSSPEYAVESYSVSAYYYLIKPATSEKLFPVLDKLLLKQKGLEDALYIKSHFGITCIPYNKLCFLEVLSKKLLFHLTDGDVKEIPGSLTEYEPILLCRKEFFKTHRSYIVNMECVQELNRKEIITYSKQMVPVSRLLYEQVRTAYMEHLFVEKGVE